MAETSQPRFRFMGVITGFTLSALLLVVRPAASLFVATAEGRTGRYWTGVVVLAAVGWAVGDAVLSSRQSPAVVGIPSMLLILLSWPLLANELHAPYWWPDWMWWANAAFDTPVLIGLLVAVAVRGWITGRQAST